MAITKKIPTLEEVNELISKNTSVSPNTVTSNNNFGFGEIIIGQGNGKEVGKSSYYFTDDEYSTGSYAIPSCYVVNKKIANANSGAGGGASGGGWETIFDGDAIATFSFEYNKYVKDGILELRIYFAATAGGTSVGDKTTFVSHIAIPINKTVMAGTYAYWSPYETNTHYIFNIKAYPQIEDSQMDDVNKIEYLLPFNKLHIYRGSYCEIESPFIAYYKIEVRR